MIYRIEKKLEGGKNLTIEILNSRVIRLLYGEVADLFAIETKPNKLILYNYKKNNIELNIGEIVKVELDNYPTAFYINSISQERPGCYTISTGYPTKAKHFLLPCLGDTKTQFGSNTYLENVYLDYKSAETEEFLFGKVLYLHYRVFDCKEFMTIDSWLLKHENFIGMITEEPYHITYIIKIPEQFYPDLAKFKLGKYSEFSKELKKSILTFHNFRDDGITGQILNNSSKLRKQLELEFGVPIPNEVELFDIPNIEKEIYISPYNDEFRYRSSL